MIGGFSQGCWNGVPPLYTTMALYFTLITVTICVIVALQLPAVQTTMWWWFTRNKAVMPEEQFAIVNTVVIRPTRLLHYSRSERVCIKSPRAQSHYASKCMAGRMRGVIVWARKNNTHYKGRRCALRATWVRSFVWVLIAELNGLCWKDTCDRPRGLAIGIFWEVFYKDAPSAL